MHVLLNRGGLAPGYADPLSMLACYLAAVRWQYRTAPCTVQHVPVRYSRVMPVSIGPSVTSIGWAHVPRRDPCTAG